MDYLKDRRNKRKAKPAPEGRLKKAFHAIINFVCFCIVGKTTDDQEPYTPSEENNKQKLTKCQTQNKPLIRSKSMPNLKRHSFIDETGSKVKTPRSELFLVKRPLHVTHVTESCQNQHKGNSKSIVHASLQSKKNTAQNTPQNHLENFQLIKVLGQGSFGKVFLAESKQPKQLFAIKVLVKTEILKDNDVESTLVERRILTLATGNLFLTHLYSAFQSETHLFYVMEYISGGDLGSHLAKSRKFDEYRAKFYAAEIICGLEFLHKHGIIYRDLKPENILLDKDGHIKLADFGMCKEDILHGKKASTMCGTPYYIAPEILKELEYDSAVDWWSFGVLLYEMLTGEMLFDGESDDELCNSICSDQIRFPRWLQPKAVNCLTQLLDRCPNERLGYRDGRNSDIRANSFFIQLNWKMLENREITPPYAPETTTESDNTVNTKRPNLTLVKESLDQEQFKGFSFVNPYS